MWRPPLNVTMTATRQRGSAAPHSTGPEDGPFASITRKISVSLSLIPGLRGRASAAGATLFNRSIRTVAVACVTIVLVASSQVHPQPAQGATLGGGSIFKGSPKVVERRLCLAIPSSAVAPLYSVKVGPPKTGFLGSTCDFVPVGMSVNDDDASPLFVEISVNDYGQMYGTFNKDDHKLSGIGNKAYWDSQAPGMDAPQVVAEKGKIDCMVTTNGEVDHTTLPYTLSGGNPVITNAAAAAFAEKMGVLCADVFEGK